MALGGVILIGGASRRMGADKAALDWAGSSALERCRALARAVGAEPVLTIGADGDIPDDTPGGGPVGGVQAGARALQARGCTRMLVLAVDAPTILAADLRPLLSDQAPGAAYAGLHLPLVVDIAALPVDAEADWPMARLIERAGLARPDCPSEARLRLRGANSPEERAALLTALLDARGAQQSGGD